MDHEVMLIASPVDIWERMREAIAVVNAPQGIELGENAMREFVAELQASFPDTRYSSTDTFSFLGLEVTLDLELHPDDVRIKGAVYN